MISEQVKRVLKNRSISYEEAGKRLGMTKQGVSWILNHRKDEGWGEKERLYWKEKLKLSEGVFNDK